MAGTDIVVETRLARDAGTPSAQIAGTIAPIVLAFLGVVVSTYLAAYQLGWLRTVWDPVFGANGSRAVLHSALDRVLPVPDALLGAGAYLVEVALGLATVVVRARIVRLVYALVAGTMALVSVGLVAMQAFVVGDGCSLCLVSAALSWSIGALVIPNALTHATATAPTHTAAKITTYRRAA